MEKSSEAIDQSLYWDNTFVEYNFTLLEDRAEISEEKNSSIYLYGSLELQQSISLGYYCEDKYLQERICLEYPEFECYGKIESAKLFKKVDTPSPEAIAQVLYWDDAYVAKREPITVNGDDRFDVLKQIKINKQEIIVIQDYLGKYKITMEVTYKRDRAFRDIKQLISQIDRRYLSGFIMGSTVCAVVTLITQASIIQLGFIVTMALLLLYWARTTPVE